MSVRTMSEAMLKLNYEQLTKEIESYYDFLRRFPATSPLGRASIKATIKHKEKQLNKIKEQYFNLTAIKLEDK